MIEIIHKKSVLHAVLLWVMDIGTEVPFLYTPLSLG